LAMFKGISTTSSRLNIAIILAFKPTKYGRSA